MTTTVNIDNKSRIPLFAVVSASAVVLPALIGFTVWITAVAADARKGAKAADKVTVIYYDVKAIKKELKIKDDPKQFTNDEGEE